MDGSLKYVHRNPAIRFAVLAFFFSVVISVGIVASALIVQATLALISIANAAKDMGYYQTMAGDAQAHLAIAAAVLGTLQGADAKAAPGTLLPELVRLLGP